MSRRRAAVKRVIHPDAKYNNVVISKFVNYLLEDGKKSVAERIVYQALDNLKAKAKADPLQVFEDAINNAKPSIEVRSRRVGGATYQIPVPVVDRRALALSIRWLINAARGRGEKSMVGKLTGELMDAAAGRGNAIKKREDTHRMAEANKAFSHYRW